MPGISRCELLKRRSCLKFKFSYVIDTIVPETNRNVVLEFTFNHVLKMILLKRYKSKCLYQKISIQNVFNIQIDLKLMHIKMKSDKDVSTFSVSAMLR